MRPVGRKWSTFEGCARLASGAFLVFSLGPPALAHEGTTSPPSTVRSSAQPAVSPEIQPDPRLSEIPGTSPSPTVRKNTEVASSQESLRPSWSGVAAPEDPAVQINSPQGHSGPRPSPATMEEQKVAETKAGGEIRLAHTSSQNIKWPGLSLAHPRLTKGSSPQLPSGEVFRNRYTSLFRSDGRPKFPGARSSYGEVSLILNSSVEESLYYFQTGIPERFQGYLDRFEQYRPVVQQIFMEFGLPVELSYLSLVESGFNPIALSHARASGPWQFMKATGNQYGLEVNWHVDERRDPVKSTVAAAFHLRDLYDQFGSWPLALAAYNAGAGKITRAIQKSGTRDYWKIRQSWQYLRRETREYVPRFIAATMIAKNPTDYGFLNTSADPYRYDEVVITRGMHLRLISKVTGISFDELQKLNPELRQNIIPARPSGYHLKVPLGTRALVENKYDELNLWSQQAPRHTQWYQVQEGDSLSVVAKRFSMSVRSLKELNKRTSNLIRVGERLRVKVDEAPGDPNATWYTVQYGDSLSEIAQEFGLSLETLQELNNLEGSLIRVGDRLRVKETSPPMSTPKWYRVREGDSLWSIAQRFSVSVTDLKLLNNLTSSVIHVGRLLVISP